MIALMLALQIVGADSRTALAYDDVPVEVVRVQAYEWQVNRPGSSVIGDRRHGQVFIRGTPHRVYVVTFVRADGSYLLDGPFPWPDADSVRTTSRRWHRTLRGTVSDDGSAGDSVEWIRADTVPGPWPMCFRDDSRNWTCWGILPENRGVVVLPLARGILWTAAGPTTPAVLSRAGWGRLLLVTDVTTSGSGLRVGFGRPLAPPPSRWRGIRLETAPIEGARAVSIGRGVVWVVGDEVPPRAWVEVRSDAGGPVYLPLPEVASGLASVPLHVTLPEFRLIAGRAFGPNAEAAPGALVTSFRLIEPSPVDGSRVLPRRVFVAETIADEEGRFKIEGLGEADYELVAWHSQLGRASVPLPSTSTEVAIRLRASGVARGRVVARGRPVPGVEVISVPDAAAFSAAEDLTDAKGGDARTGPDGRFSVITAASGGGELRIGGGKHDVKRVALPRPAVPVFDVGDIDLGEPIAVTVLLDRDPRCEVRAAGPVGRTGLQVVPGARTADGSYSFRLPEAGLWEFSLACVGERLSLSPGAMHVGAAQAGKELRFVVR